jgi:hypothetical protein
MVGAMTPSLTGPATAAVGLEQRISLEQRMRRHMVTSVAIETEKTTQRSSPSVSSNGVRKVKTLKEYTRMIQELVHAEAADAATTAPLTVVHFHSSYCPSCKRSLPFYNVASCCDSLLFNKTTRESIRVDRQTLPGTLAQNVPMRAKVVILPKCNFTENSAVVLYVDRHRGNANGETPLPVIYK